MLKLAVIPARGGSKRIPKKNVKTFFGKPMIAWSIEAAKKTGIFDQIIVSTDDMDIAEIATACGAEIPFIRPAHLADDFTTASEVVAHVVQWAQFHNLPVEAICCIYATAPFVQAEDIINGFNELCSGKWEYVFSATDFGAPIFRSFKILPQGGVEMFFPEYFSIRSQDLPEAFHDAGQFYWGLPASWLECKKIFDAHSKALLIPRWRVQDIDNQSDWERAESIASLILS